MFQQQICLASIVVCHFQTSSLEATLDIETLIGLTAIKDTLVTAHILSNIIQSLDYSTLR